MTVPRDETVSEASASTLGLAAASGDTVAIARRLALSAKGVIGFLPVTRSRPDAHRALLDAVATALTQFVSGEVAVVGDWRGWQGDPPDSPDSDDVAAPEAPGSDGRLGAGARRVRRLSPGAVSDRARASIELRKILAARSGEGLRTLVNLADYARPGVIPAPADWMEGVALLVRVRRARWKRVAALVRGIASERQLGAILIE